jgi:hypothetical protein
VIFAGLFKSDGTLHRNTGLGDLDGRTLDGQRQTTGADPFETRRRGGYLGSKSASFDELCPNLHGSAEDGEVSVAAR